MFYYLVQTPSEFFDNFIGGFFYVLHVFGPFVCYGQQTLASSFDHIVCDKTDRLSTETRYLKIVERQFKWNSYFVFELFGLGKGTLTFALGAILSVGAEATPLFMTLLKFFRSRDSSMLRHPTHLQLLEQAIFA